MGLNDLQQVREALDDLLWEFPDEIMDEGYQPRKATLGTNAMQNISEALRTLNSSLWGE